MSLQGMFLLQENVISTVPQSLPFTIHPQTFRIVLYKLWLVKVSGFVSLFYRLRVWNRHSAGTLWGTVQ